MGLADIKKLRDITSLGINECKRALEEASGDVDHALQILKKRGIQLVEKKKSRQASQGLIEAYVHFGGNLGALVEVNCETDFVARTEGFKQFVKDIAMHVVAANPKYIKKEDIPQEEYESCGDRQEYSKQVCLLEQLFVKDNQMTIKDYLQEVISQTGENVIIKRFVRYSLAEDNES